MQNDPDPFRAFDDSDRTVFVPTPGGRRRGGAAAETPAPPPLPPADDSAERHLPEGVGSNPLLKAAASLFALVRQLRNTRRHDDVPGLRRDLITAVRQFDVDARSAGVDAKTAGQAGYALCALLDETVLGTPWGLNSIWGQQSLSITFFKENVAGEQLFGFLNKARELPQQHIDLLEFVYVCLSLGFEGRFRLEEGGRDRIGRLREELYNVISRVRGEGHRELSPHWRGVTDRRPAFSRYVPLWVVAAALAGIVLLAFLGFSWRLNDASDLTYAKIATLLPTPAPDPAKPPPPPKPDGLVVRLRALLAPEIEKGLVEVRDLGDAANLVLFNKGLFPVGGASIGPAFEPVVRKVGVFLAGLRGPFTITGHTDSLPIRTLRFPSNWHLSEARAEAVADVLKANVADAGSLRILGRADTEPLASNATAEGKELNRRVEIRIPVY